MQKHCCTFFGMSCAPRHSDVTERAVGALIVDIDPTSSAAKAGVQAGHVILEINHEAIHGPEHALQISQAIKRERVLLRIWAGGRIRYFLVDSGLGNGPQPRPFSVRRSA